MISFEGIPAVYFNSLFGKANDEAKYVITGNNRDVNRYKWNHKNITKKLSEKASKQSIFYKSLGKLLEIKRKQKAFHPNAKRLNINLGSKLFCFKRISLDKKQSIISITNCSSVNQYPKLDQKYCKWKNIISPKIKSLNKSLKLKPFETMWLSNI